MGEDRQDTRTTPPGRKLSVSEAAAALGISAEAVRSRVKRGTLPSVKEGASVYVLLEADQTPPGYDQTTDQTAARSPSDSTALISEMRGRIEDLRERVQSLERQLDARQEEIRRRDILLANLVERVPQAPLEAPQEAPEAAETAREASEGAEPRSYAPDTHSEAEAAQPRLRASWWRRMFGG